MAAVLPFYTDALGFQLRRGSATEDHVSLEHDGDSLMLERPADFYSAAYNEAIEKRMGTPSPHAIYIEHPELEKLHSSLLGKGFSIIDPLADRPWGQAEFTVADPEGNWLTFWKALS
jgi:uncharacterized glyoxalase superfamily protein PhnB